MPEGPSLLIAREQIESFSGERIVQAHGNAAINVGRLQGQRIIAVRTWGKHLLIELDGFSLRIHLLMFGTYLVDARKDAVPRLRLGFAGGREINFYTCSVKYIEGPLDQAYDWAADVLSELWDPAGARRKLRAMPDTLVCDALLDQSVFSGVGNIIKNEVLFRIRMHPLSQVGALPAHKLRALVEQARQYSFDFLEWKRAGVLKRHWLAHTRSVCPRCDIPFSKAHLGTTRRRSFFCDLCQINYQPHA